MKNILTTFSKFAAFLVMLSLISFTACEKEPLKPKHAKAVISGTNAEVIVTGTLNFIQEKDGFVKLDLEVLVPSRANSSVAVHLHEHGDCGNGGTNAHGHWNPTGKSHGKWDSNDFHAGDIGNIALDEQGRGQLQLRTKLWSIGGEDLTNIVGKGVIVHGGVDDYTQPAGNSGPRIGCGVIELKN